MAEHNTRAGAGVPVDSVPVGAFFARQRGHGVGRVEEIDERTRLGSVAFGVPLERSQPSGQGAGGAGWVSGAQRGGTVMVLSFPGLFYLAPLGSLPVRPRGRNLGAQSDSSHIVELDSLITMNATCR